MSRIFINYRRDDSAGYAGRIYDRLANHFGRAHIFIDIDHIAPGEDFIEVIHEKLRSVQVAVMLIGKQWLDITDATGQRRLDNPDDFVRLEIATLLEKKIRVIPILIGGAIMPNSTQLPKCLAPLTRRHAHEISDHRFHADVDKLVQVLEKIMGVQPPPLPPKPPKFHRLATILGASGILLAAIVLFHYSPWTAQESDTIPPKPVASESKGFVTKQPVVASPSDAKLPQKNQLVVEQSKETQLPQIIDASKAFTPSSEKRLPFEPEMVRIPSGKFIMGSPENEPERFSDEGPQHEVTIAYAFEIGKYEVTFNEYDAFANATNRQLPDDEGWGRGRRPVINVSFNDVQAYLQWLSKQTGKQYRLPTEAEWEYTARAGTQTTYWWGDNVDRKNGICPGCVRKGSGYKQTAPVGSSQPNPFGLYDTAANVREWVQDCRQANYQNAPSDGSAWLDNDGGNCDRRVVRSSSFSEGGEIYIRSAFRGRIYLAEAGRHLGFRIARDF